MPNVSSFDRLALSSTGAAAALMIVVVVGRLAGRYILTLAVHPSYDRLIFSEQMDVMKLMMMLRKLTTLTLTVATDLSLENVVHPSRNVQMNMGSRSCRRPTTATVHVLVGPPRFHFDNDNVFRDAEAVMTTTMTTSIQEFVLSVVVS